MRSIFEDPKRREEFHFQGCVQLFLVVPGAIFAAVLAALIVSALLTGVEKPSPSGSGVVRQPPIPIPPAPPVDLGPEPYRFLGLTFSDVALHRFGNFSRFSLPEQRGHGLCFRDQGLDLLFDESGLEKIIFYLGFPDEHNHRTYPGPLPFGIQFEKGRPSPARVAIRAYIATKLGSQAQYSLLDGNCDSWDVISANHQLSFQLAVDYHNDQIEKVSLVRKHVQRLPAEPGG